MSTVFQVMAKEINEDIQRLTNVLVSNGVESIEDYRYLVGQLRGLQVALNRFQALEAKVINDDLED